MSPLALNNDRIRNWVAEQSPIHSKHEYEIAVGWFGDRYMVLPIEIWHSLKNQVSIESSAVKYDTFQFYHYAVALDGTGPFDIYEFDHFLESNKIHAVNLEHSSWFDQYIMVGSDQILVVGEDNWEAERLKEFLDSSPEETNGRLCVYSQEMFLFRIMSGIDPFDAPREVLEEFGRDNSALEFLSTLGFDWPSCQNFAPGYGEFEPTEIGPKVGVLKRFGYQVGVNGIHNADRRRQILERVYTLQLPSHLAKGLSAADVDEWGEPKSTQRLKKLADSLAAFARNAQRRGTDNSLAIQHWESDLAWLKAKFYTGVFRFQWPGN